MTIRFLLRSGAMPGLGLVLVLAFVLAFALAGCGHGIFGAGPFSRNGAPAAGSAQTRTVQTETVQEKPMRGDAGVNDVALVNRAQDKTRHDKIRKDERESKIWDLFTDRTPPDTTIKVNKYLWQASLQVLDFLPIRSVDPFSGVIVTGYGTPPGGTRAYRATVYVPDPALDARSLKVAIETRNGAVSADTRRAVEDAILTRARQLRVQDSNL